MVIHEEDTAAHIKTNLSGDRLPSVYEVANIVRMLPALRAEVVVGKFPGWNSFTRSKYILRDASNQFLADIFVSDFIDEATTHLKASAIEHDKREALLSLLVYGPVIIGDLLGRIEKLEADAGRKPLE